MGVIMCSSNLTILAHSQKSTAHLARRSLCDQGTMLCDCGALMAGWMTSG